MSRLKLYNFRESLEKHLLDRGLRPFPSGHSLPECINTELHQTRCAYEGEPRGIPARALALSRCPQYWAPLWVDIVVKVYSGACWDDAGNPTLGLKIRDSILRMLSNDTTKRDQLMAVYRLGGLDAVAKLLGLEEAPPMVTRAHDWQL
jgi:hypothetical protein